jgi:hypothetical protein
MTDLGPLYAFCKLGRASSRCRNTHRSAMNKLRDFPANNVAHASQHGGALTTTTYRPAGTTLGDMARKPATVTGAVLGVAALGYFALMIKGGTHAK